MAEYASYLSCSFCELSHDTTDTHCISCGGGLDQDERQTDVNEILLALVTQVSSVVSRKARDVLGSHRELKMSATTGVLCAVWMFSCLLFVGMPSIGVAVSGGDTAMATQTIDGGQGSALEPTLQAALEDR